MGPEINIIHKKPLVFPLLKLLFPVLDWEKHVITIGNTIYSKNSISESVMEHEKTHIEQFRRSCLHFWRYVFSGAYRFESELEAFANECKVFPQNIDRAAEILSGPLYKKKITINKTKKLLCEYLRQK